MCKQSSCLAEPGCESIAVRTLLYFHQIWERFPHFGLAAVLSDHISSVAPSLYTFYFASRWVCRISSNIDHVVSGRIWHSVFRSFSLEWGGHVKYETSREWLSFQWMYWAEKRWQEMPIQTSADGKMCTSCFDRSPYFVSLLLKHLTAVRKSPVKNKCRFIDFERMRRTFSF